MKPLNGCVLFWLFVVIPDISGQHEINQLAYCGVFFVDLDS